MVDPTTRIIQSDQRYKSAPLSDQFLNIPFTQNMKELIEFDRTVDISLITVFDEERQASSIFRPVTKFTLLFENAYTGSTTYVPFRDNLYYTDAIQNAVSYYPSGISITGNTSNVPPLPIICCRTYGFKL